MSQFKSTDTMAELLVREGAAGHSSIAAEGVIVLDIQLVY